MTVLPSFLSNYHFSGFAFTALGFTAFVFFTVPFAELVFLTADFTEPVRFLVTVEADFFLAAPIVLGVGLSPSAFSSLFFFWIFFFSFSNSLTVVLLAAQNFYTDA